MVFRIQHANAIQLPSRIPNALEIDAPPRSPISATAVSSKRASTGQSAYKRALLEQICQPALLPTLLAPLNTSERLRFLLAQFGSPKNALMALLDSHTVTMYDGTLNANTKPTTVDGVLHGFPEMRVAALRAARATRYEDVSSSAVLQQAAAVLPHLEHSHDQQIQCLELLDQYWPILATMDCHQSAQVLAALSHALPVINDIQHWHNVMQKIAGALPLQPIEQQLPVLTSLVNAAIHCDVEEQASVLGLVSQCVSRRIDDFECMTPVVACIANHLDAFSPVLRSQAFYVFKTGFDALSHGALQQLDLLAALLDHLEGANSALQKWAIDVVEQQVVNKQVDNARPTKTPTAMTTSTCATLLILARSLQQIAPPLQARTLQLLLDSTNHFDAHRDHRERICLALAHGAIADPRTTDTVRETAFIWIYGQLETLPRQARQVALTDLVAESGAFDPVRRRALCNRAMDELAPATANTTLLRMLVVAAPRFDADQRHRILAASGPAIDALSTRQDEQVAVALAIITTLPELAHDPIAGQMIRDILENRIGLMTPPTPMLAEILGTVSEAVPRVLPDTAQYLLNYLMQRTHHLVGHPADMTSLLSKMLLAGSHSQATTPIVDALYRAVADHLKYLPTGDETRQCLTQVVQRLPHQHGLLFQQIAQL